MSLNRVRIILLSLSMLLIIIVLSLIGTINFATFKQNYTESLSSSYKVLADQTVRKIEYAVRYGKPLNNFLGMEEILTENTNGYREFNEIQIVLPGGDIIYNQDGKVTDRQLSPALKEKVVFYGSSSTNIVYELDDENYYIYSPIYDKDGTWIASLGLVLDERVVTTELNQYIYQLVYYFLGAVITIFIGLLLFFYKVPLFNNQRILLKKRILIFVLVFLGISQFLFGALNYYSLKNGYLEIVKENTSFALNVIQSDIEQVISKGANYSDLYGVGKYMNDMIASLPEISRISIINSDHTTETINEDLFVSKYSYSSPLMKDQLAQSTYINVVDLSESYINEKTKNILLDTLTMIILSQILIVEMTMFVLLYLEKQILNYRGGAANKDIEDRKKPERLFIRPVAFLLVVAATLSYSYIPIILQLSFDSFISVPYVVVSALPIIVETLSILVAALLAAPMCERKGWKPVFFLGMSLLTIGTVGSAISWNAFAFLCARIIAGFGLGYSLMSLYRFAYTGMSNKENRNTFHEFQSGSAAGMFFGITVGSILAEQIGVLNVYLVAIPIFILALLLAFKFMPNRIGKRVYRRRLYFKLKKLGVHSLQNFKVISFIPLVVIPITVASMFLFYFSPIYANDYGESITSIGRFFLYYGIFIVYLKPFYNRYASQYISGKSSMIMSSLFILIGFAIFALNESLFSIVIALTFLGIASAVGSSAQFEYFKSYAAHIEYNEGKVVGYYLLFEYFGKLVGSVIFAICLMSLSDAISVISLGALICIATILYFIIANKKEKMELQHNVGGNN